MSEQKNPLEMAGEMLGNLKERAEDVMADVAEGAENLAEGLVGEETVEKVKSVMNTDVGVIAENLKDKAEDALGDLKEQAEGLKDKLTGGGDKA